MKTNLNKWVVPSAIAVSLLMGSPVVIAENDLSPSSESALTAPSQWEVRKHDEIDAVELVTKLAQGSFSTMCSDGSCGVFVEPEAGCVPGAKYPLLINSAKQVGVVPTQCTMIPGGKEGEMRYVVLLQQQKTLLKAMMNEVDLTIAFPTQAGQMNVLEVKMSGVRDVLATMMPSLEGADSSSSSSSASDAKRKETSHDDGVSREYNL